eukprot:14051245-Alexandrium_andersonii.AAC.1
MQQRAPSTQRSLGNRRMSRHMGHVTTMRRLPSELCMLGARCMPGCIVRSLLPGTHSTTHAASVCACACVCVCVCVRVRVRVRARVSKPSLGLGVFLWLVTLHVALAHD